MSRRAYVPWKAFPGLGRGMRIVQHFERISSDDVFVVREPKCWTSKYSGCFSAQCPKKCRAEGKQHGAKAMISVYRLHGPRGGVG